MLISFLEHTSDLMMITTKDAAFLQDGESLYQGGEYKNNLFTCISLIAVRVIFMLSSLVINMEL
jgi:hypothetical protein